MNEIEEKNVRAIETLTATIAVLAYRAIELEREGDAARKDADLWHEAYKSKDDKLKRLEEIYARETDEHELVRKRLEEAQLLIHELTEAQESSDDDDGYFG